MNIFNSNTCENCPEKECCGEICDKIEALINDKFNDRIDFIEIPFCNGMLEKLADSKVDIYEKTDVDLQEEKRLKIQDVVFGIIDSDIKQEHKEFVIMKFLAGMTQVDASKILETSPAVVSYRGKVALTKIREKYVRITGS